MTREIKFRVWVTSGLDSGYMHNFDMSSDGYPRFQWDRAVLEQYTGLKDKNGKEIYEGDIVKFKGIKPTFIVEYNEPCAKFWAKCKNGLVEEFEDWSEEETEVIGTIHENPELLEKGEENE